VVIVDDGDAGYSAPGWSEVGGANYFQGDTGYRYGPAGGSAAQFSANLAAGTYRVSATWGANPVWTTGAVFTVTDGAGNVLATRTLNEQSAPNDFSAGGASWADLGNVTLSSAGGLVVKVTGGTSGQFLIADAVRFEQVSGSGAAALAPAAGSAVLPPEGQHGAVSGQAEQTAVPAETRVRQEQLPPAARTGGDTLSDLVLATDRAQVQVGDFGLSLNISAG
jgi:hypothetical protein